VIEPGASTRVYGIVGWPLRHTASPALHNAAFHAAGVDAVYVAFPVRPERLRAAVAGLAAVGVGGVNVTMPHKEEAALLADELEDRRSGAANTLTFEGGRVVATNTDVEAFGAFLLEDAGFDPRDRSVLLLGAGGAARACAVALGEAGAGRLVVAARRPEAARRVTEVAAGVGESDVVPCDEAAAVADEADLVVNATSLGWEGEEVPLRPRPGQVAVDLVYRSTPFLEAARAAGAEAHDGLGMLVRQAALAFRIWTGFEAPMAAMAAAVGWDDRPSG
jgi:shikimate dehydrogenase